MEIYYNQEWARDERYSSFWAHYSAVEKWRTDHARMAEIACRVARNKKRPNQRRKTGKALEFNLNYVILLLFLPVSLVLPISAPVIEIHIEKLYKKLKWKKSRK